MFQIYTTHDTPQVSDPISDTQPSFKVRAFIRGEAYREANKIWNMGKEIGMTTRQKDGDIIQALVELEERDKAQCKENEKFNPKAGMQTVS